MERLPVTQYVSFDVFDTLLKRSVAQPKDVFYLMEALPADMAKIPAGFAQKRIKAEENAQKRIGKPPTIRQIYERIRNEYGEIATEWMDVELKMEMEGCEPAPANVELLQRCVNAGKTVILISDMYLSAEFIARMLDKCGIGGYEKLYVSCEWGASKRDGTLFRCVLSDLEIRPHQLTHIGDNRRNDGLVPLSMGIRIRSVRNDRKRICEIPSFISSDSAFTYRTLRAAVRNCSNGMGEVERQGCECFGPLLLGFTLWLVEKLHRNGIKDVYFMARDGYIMKQAFDLLQIPGIRTHYLYCSRRSYIVPLLYKHSEFSDTIRYIRDKQKIVFRHYQERMGLDPELYREQAKQFGLDIDRQYTDGAFFKAEEQAKIKAFYEYIHQDVINNARKEYEAILAYLDGLNLPPKIGVVDIGYCGTMQHALTRLLEDAGKEINVTGYYVAIKPNAPLPLEGAVKMEGYLYSMTLNPQYSHLTTDCIPIFENQFLLAPHGSVKRFVMKQSTAEPEFCEQEFEQDSMLKDYQQGALKLVQYAKEHLPLNALHIQPDMALCEFVRLTQKPTLHEAKLWGDLGFHDLGVVMFCARPRSVLQYLRHPGQFKKDFLKCMWKIGFMKRFFKIPLPYDRIYHFLQGCYNKNT